MIPPFVLIILFAVWFITTCIHLIRRGDDVSALAYVVLFVYTIFAQIGYAYYPHLSAALNAYFGPELFYDYWLFMSASFVCAFVLHRVVQGQHRQTPLYIAEHAPRPVVWLGVRVFLGILIGSLLIGYLRNVDSIRYQGGVLVSQWFSLGFGYLKLVVLLFYCHLRLLRPQRTDACVSLCLLAAAGGVLVLVSIAAGNRSEIFYAAVGVACVEGMPFREAFRRHKRGLIVGAAVGIVLLYSLSVLEYVRARYNPITPSLLAEVFMEPSEILSDGEWLETVVNKDYYAPSHVLIVSMYYKASSLSEVLTSNVANAMVGVHSPTLSELTVGRVWEGTDRGVGWAYHFFAEGYHAVGWCGVLYNGVLWMIGMAVCGRVCTSDSIQLNRAFRAAMGMLMVNAMRSQSSLLVRYLWMYMAPWVWCVSVASRSRLRVRWPAVSVTRMARGREGV